MNQSSSNFNHSYMTSRLTKTADVNLRNSSERNKIMVVKKIIVISSMKKQIKKIMQKLIENGLASFREQHSLALMDEAKKILDNDKQQELAKQLDKLCSEQENQLPMSDTILKLVKYYVVSPTERSYINKIEKQLKEDEQLDNDIKQIESQINEQKNNKLAIYDLEKKGEALSMSNKVINRKKEVQHYENKLMRSNQKLNELCANNNKLRDKISQLRKEKNAMETIYNKLKEQLDRKNENVENTIQYANEANKARYLAEKELKTLKEKAEQKKQKFKEECHKLNNEIQHDIRFKQFVKSKYIEKDQLDKLQEQIRTNQKNIEDKKESNQRIDQEYRKSIAKEQEIKKAFNIIKKEIGIGDTGIENEGKQLLKIFNDLYEKNSIMTNFVEELGKEVQELESKIGSKREEIKGMYLRGPSNPSDAQSLNADLKNRVEYQIRKAQLLEKQFEKSHKTIDLIKKHLIEVFEEINVSSEVIEKLKLCNITEDNLTEFLSELEKKGLQAISYYGKLIGEQLKAEKGSSWEVQKQIEDLNNIITLENANCTENTANRASESPSEMLIKMKDEKLKEDENEKLLTKQDFKKFAIESLEQYQKKQSVVKKVQRPKYNNSSQNSVHLVMKNKKKPKINESK